MRAQQTYMLVFSWPLAAFAQSHWLSHFMCRIIFLLGENALISSKRMLEEDKQFSLFYSVFVTYVAVLGGELYFYLMRKSQAYLFLQAKVVEQQQKQLSDLLHAVPDSVLICSK
jgi:hypothetical protein